MVAEEVVHWEGGQFARLCRFDVHFERANRLKHPLREGGRRLTKKGARERGGRSTTRCPRGSCRMRPAGEHACHGTRNLDSFRVH